MIKRVFISIETFSEAFQTYLLTAVWFINEKLTSIYKEYTFLKKSNRVKKNA